jgi:hypothetical protein
MNVKLLRRIQKHILAEPQRLLMAEGIVQGNPGEAKSGWFGPSGEPAQIILPNCGTAGCIAGWACILETKDKANLPRIWPQVRYGAAELIGIPDGRGEGGQNLFHVRFWPAKFKRAYLKAKRQKTRAKIAAARIEHFIATKGAK